MAAETGILLEARPKFVYKVNKCHSLVQQKASSPDEDEIRTVPQRHPARTQALSEMFTDIEDNLPTVAFLP